MNKFIHYNFLIRFGLGTIFLANSLTAFFVPSEFIELINNSFMVNFLPIRPEIFVPLIIGLNDAIVALLFFFGIATRRVGLWAFIWLIGVMIIIASPLGILEHVGFLFMVLALIREDTYLTKNI